MIEKIIEVCVRNKFFVILITGAVIVGGTIAMLNIPMDAIPDLSDVQVILFTSFPGQAPQVVKLWHEKMEAFGHAHEHIDLPVAKRIYVAPSMEEADSDLAGLQDFSNNVMRSIGTTGAPIGMPTDKDGNLPKGYESWASRQQDREQRDDVGHAGMAPLFGTPEVVRERLSLAQEQGINRIFSQFGVPGVPHKKVMRALEMFGTKVMPHFREQPATVAD